MSKKNVKNTNIDDPQPITTFTDPTLYRSFKGHKDAVLASVFNKTK